MTDAEAMKLLQRLRAQVDAAIVMFDKQGTKPALHYNLPRGIILVGDFRIEDLREITKPRCCCHD